MKKECVVHYQYSSARTLVKSLHVGDQTHKFLSMCQHIEDRASYNFNVILLSINGHYYCPFDDCLSYVIFQIKFPFDINYF